MTKKSEETKSRAQGLTLIEVVISLAIVAVILVALLSLYTTGQKYFINESARAATIEASRYPLAWITRDVKEATGVVSAWDVYATSSNSLVLQLPSVDSSGVIIDIATNFDYIIYRVNSNKLERIIDALDGVSARSDGSRVLAENVNSMVISYYDSAGGVLTSGFEAATNLSLALTTSRQGLGRTFQETLSTGVKLRNKAS